MAMKESYIEGIYAGWLAKIIGIRLGAPVEGWTYEKIKNMGSLIIIRLIIMSLRRMMTAMDRCFS